MVRKARREILRFNDIHDDDDISSVCPALVAIACMHAHIVHVPEGGASLVLHVQRTHLQSIVAHGSLVGFVISA